MEGIAYKTFPLKLLSEMCTVGSACIFIHYAKGGTFSLQYDVELTKLQIIPNLKEAAEKKSCFIYLVHNITIDVSEFKMLGFLSDQEKTLWA